jgi:hypothetical protein
MAKEIAGRRLVRLRWSAPSVSSLVGFFFCSQLFSLFIPPMKLRQIVPKGRHMIFRRQEINQKKEHFRTRRKFEMKKKHTCIYINVIVPDFSTANPVIVLISRVRLHYLVNSILFFAFSAYFSN